MDEAGKWKRLVEHLDAWSAASEIARGRIEVSVPHATGRRQAVVVMTPEQWDDMTGVMWGNVDDAVEDVKRTLLALQPHEGFAVYAEYRLEPSAEATLPESPDPTPKLGGGWSTSRNSRGGRFADWSERGPHG